MANDNKVYFGFLVTCKYLGTLIKKMFEQKLVSCDNCNNLVSCHATFQVDETLGCLSNNTFIMNNLINGGSNQFLPMQY